ncbi:AfsR/SARP family transcriptional regulator [Amycolatopsis lurida]
MLLAALAVSDGGWVSTDALIAYCWGERLPSWPRRALQSVVGRLRGSVGRNTVRTAGDGYALDPDLVHVDLAQFRALVSCADDAAATGSQADEHDSLRQAVALWRGDPLTGVQSDELRAAVAAQLDDEWTTAVLRRVDLDLAEGRHRELTGELRALTARHPLREAFWHRLVTALYSAGLRADAFAAYREVQAVLRDELGIDPSAELRELYQSMLNDELVVPEDTERTAPTRDRPPATLRTESQTVSPPVPRQLPASTVHFTGRGDQLTRLLGLCPTNLDDRDGAAAGTVVISAVEGMAGVGKTTLAVHAAHRLAGRFDDGALFVDLRGFTPGADPLTSEQALDHLLRGLGVAGDQLPPDLDTRATLYRTVLAQRRVLIVLDNAADETQLKPLLPSAPGCWVVVTSRRHLAGLDDAVHLSLPVLPAAEAAALFRALVADRATPADANVIEEIVALCGHLPLAIRIAAARLRSSRSSTPARLLAELTQTLGTGQGLDWLSDGHRAVTAALGVSYRHLTQDQQHAFRLLGLHPGSDIEPYALAALANTTIDHAQRLLDQLHAASLIDQTDYRRYTLHDLVATYARTLAHQDPEPDQHTALGRLFGHYAYTTSVAMALACPWDAAFPWEADQRPRTPATETPTPSLDDDGQALCWLDTELDNLLAAARHAPSHGRPDHTSHQAIVLHRHLRIRGRYTDANTLHSQALHHARMTGNRTGEHNALQGLSCIHGWQGRYEQAGDCDRRALAIAREIGNRTGEQLALHGLGDVHKMQNRFGPATDYLERALAIAREIGNRIAEQDISHCLGSLHQSLGRYEQATDCYQRALAINRDIGHRSGEQAALQGLGDVEWLQGRHKSAIDIYQQVLAMSRETGNPTNEQDALCALGYAHLGLGQHKTAADCYQQALIITRQTGDRVCQFEAHQGLGRVHHATGHHREALDHHHTALGLATELGQPANQARAHDGLAHTHHALGDTSQTRRHWHTALDILTNLNLDHTDEPDVTTAAIHTHLTAVNHNEAEPTTR